MDKKAITEDMNEQKEWYEKGKNITLDELPEFLKGLMTNYAHDYGTICHAISAGAIATMWAMNNHERGGITGFQAGAVMWNVVKEWNYSSNKTGLKITDYDDFLYPQYEDKFDKTIKSSIWKAIQEEAEKKINEVDEDTIKYIEDMQQYTIDIENFKEKYPDYDENPEKYKRLSCGTSEEWAAEREKEESGFEFAPKKPCHLGPHDNVYSHWKSIVEGRMPFGYKIAD